MNPPALSTMWLQNRYDRLVDFFLAGRDMGFTRFELSHILLVLHAARGASRRPAPAGDRVSAGTMNAERRIQHPTRRLPCA